ncbi:MAG: Sec-independent protein translocase subunit TatA [Pseudomonadales bacterium]|jgi:sec-independent protein translocase protein TatA|nr:Sec-independent protein translocase subunit TatA [Pseudomonadales bacterium]
MGTFSLWHWIVLLVVVVLVFGTKKLGNLGSDLGHAIQGFKKAMDEGKTDAPPEQLSNDSEQGGATVAAKAEHADEKP